MKPYLIYVRFKLPIRYQLSGLVSLTTWINRKGAHVIAGWSNTVHMLAMLADPKAEFEVLKQQLATEGLDDLSMVQLGARCWSYEDPLIALDEEPEEEWLSEDEVRNQAEIEAVFGQGAGDLDEEEDDELFDFSVPMTGANPWASRWPIQTWLDNAFHFAPDDRPRWGSKALLLVFREDYENEPNLVLRLKERVGIQATGRWHGRATRLITFGSPHEPKTICEREPIKRWLTDRQLYAAACFEVGPTALTLHPLLDGSLVPAIPNSAYYQRQASRGGRASGSR